MGDSYQQDGHRVPAEGRRAYARIVQGLSAESATPTTPRRGCTTLEMPVPEADPAAYARMKYEQENRTKPGMLHRVDWTFLQLARMLRRRPNPALPR